MVTEPGAKEVERASQDFDKIFDVNMLLCKQLFCSYWIIF